MPVTKPMPSAGEPQGTQPATRNGVRGPEYRRRPPRVPSASPLGVGASPGDASPVPLSPSGIGDAGDEDVPTGTLPEAWGRTPSPPRSSTGPGGDPPPARSQTRRTRPVRSVTRHTAKPA